MKHCTKCGEDKPLDEFHNDKHSSDGKTRRCKSCNIEYSKAQRAKDPVAYDRRTHQYRHNNWDHFLDWRSEHRVREFDALQNYRLSWRFGLTLEGYYAELSAQGGVCKICGTDKPGGRSEDFFPVDHDHACCDGDKSCGKCVRGIVCHRCNSYVLPVYEGKINGDIESLFVLVKAYVDEYTERRALLDEEMKDCD